MNVCLLAPFRNSARRVPGYMIRVRRLQDLLGTKVRVIAGEGDSTDNTRQSLLDHSANQSIALDLLSVNHGGPVFGSVEDPLRFKQLSLVQNALFNAVRPTDDVAVYLEHDLVWEPDVVKQLIDAAHADGGVHAPMVWAEGMRRFYDIWAFRNLDGSRFPLFPTVEDPSPFEVASVGSCFAMPAGDTAGAWCADDNSLIGLCKQMRNYTNIFVHPSLSVWHPDQT